MELRCLGDHRLAEGLLRARDGQCGSCSAGGGHVGEMDRTYRGARRGRDHVRWKLAWSTIHLRKGRVNYFN